MIEVEMNSFQLAFLAACIGDCFRLLRVTSDEFKARFMSDRGFPAGRWLLSGSNMGAFSGFDY